MEGGGKNQAVQPLPDRGQHVFRANGGGGAHTAAALGGQSAVIAQRIDLIRHGLPVILCRLRGFIHALILCGTANGPVKAAAGVIVLLGAAEIILQLWVFLQPVAQRLQLGHGFIQLFAHLGRNAHLFHGFGFLHAVHCANGCGKAALRKIRQGKQAVIAVIEAAHR